MISSYIKVFMTEMFSAKIFILTALTVYGIVECKYEPTWESLDSRPLPDWYDQAKVGIFLHWGVFSVPSFGSEWFWSSWHSKSKDYVNFMKRNYKPNFGYQDFAPEFTAEFYDPDKWADIFQASGAKYIVLTSKHHEGFTLWPSKVSWNWNAMDVGPKRDLLAHIYHWNHSMSTNLGALARSPSILMYSLQNVRRISEMDIGKLSESDVQGLTSDLAKAIRNKTDLHFGVYHSMYEWFHPLYLLDKNNSYKTQHFVKSKTIPELIELVTQYQPHVIWSDGDWEAPDDYWTSKEFLAWLYNESPVKDVVAVNDRWGKDIPCKHGGYFTCQDRYNPKKLQNHKWENAMTLDKQSWGYRRNADLNDFLTIEDLLTQLAETISCGGNLLINVGPTHDGRIAPIFQERLRQLGSWLKVNGDAIYGTTPWKAQNDSVTPGVWYTSKGDTVNAIVLNWPKNNVLKLGSLPVADKDILTMLGVPGQLVHRNVGNIVEVTFPTLVPVSVPRMGAWVLQLKKTQRNRV